MEISVYNPGLNWNKERTLLDHTVIILDIFRATSFIVTALALGAKYLIPVSSIAAAKSHFREGRLLAGERAAKKISGFHLGNSPCELRNILLYGKEIILTTTNGTKAIAKAQQAQNRLIGSFLNLSACSRRAVRLGLPITIVCAGTRGTFSLEDGVAAGGIIDACIKMQPNCKVDDLGMMARQSYLAWCAQGWNQLKESRSGQRIQKLGSEQDLDYCLQIDRFPIVPIVTKENVIEVESVN